MQPCCMMPPSSSQFWLYKLQEQLFTRYEEPLQKFADIHIAHKLLTDLVHACPLADCFEDGEDCLLKVAASVLGQFIDGDVGGCVTCRWRAHKH